jgi:hypothetical protein
MPINLPKILLIFILFINCTNNRDVNAISNNNSSKTTSEQLYNKAEAYFNEKRLEESKKELIILKHKFPESEEIYKANILLKKIEAEFIKIKHDDLIIEIKKKDEKKHIFLTETKDLYIKTDNLEGITWYQDKSSPRNINKNGFYLYIACRDYNYPSLRLKIQYADDDWLFINKYQIYADGVKYLIEPKNDKIKRDNGGGDIWEWLDISVGEVELDILTAVANANNVNIRYVGEKYYEDKTLSVNEKKALKNILDIYTKIGGEIY